jgi:N-acetyltransferase 10
LPPIDEKNASSLPEPLCVLQVCLEGAIAKGSALSSLARGVRSSGDLIPWVVSQQFQDDDFATLSGARVVRIATHSDYSSMGYGTRALEQLEEYFSGKIQSLSEDDVPMIQEMPRITDEELQDASILTETIKVRDSASMPPMLLKLSQRPLKEHLHWLGVSYGLTAPLHKFWKRSGYKPVYLRQTQNDLTGEHTCIMLKTLQVPGNEVVVGKESWLSDFSQDFRRRFLQLLAYQFRTFSPLLVLSIVDATSDSSEQSLGSVTSTGNSYITNIKSI